MRRLLNLVMQLVAVALFVVLLTVFWVIFDGLHDEGDKADVGLVTSHAEPAKDAPDPLLDRVMDLYKEGRFPAVIVAGPTWREIGTVDVATMATYLEAHGLPTSAIIIDNGGSTIQEMALSVAEVMRTHQFQSVMIVSNYYQVTREKLALTHEGIEEIQKAHAGKLQKEDAVKISQEVIALYDYVGKVYVMPTAEKVKKEAQVGMDKANADATEAKKSVNKGLDGLAK